MQGSLVVRTAGAPPAGGLVQVCELWVWTVLVALLGTWTCFAAVPGVNWTIWTVMAAIGFVAVRLHAVRLHAVPGTQPRLRRDAHAFAALMIAILLSAGAAMTANPFLDALVFLTVATLGAFVVLTLSRSPDGLGPAAVALSPMIVGRSVLGEAAARLTEVLTIARMRDAAPVLRGAGLAASVALALLLLLSAADPTLTDWRDTIWESTRSWTFVVRDLFFVGLTVVLLGAYGLAERTVPTTAPARADEAREPIEPRSPGSSLSELERLMVLGTAVASFVLFFAVQLSHYFGLITVGLGAGTLGTAGTGATLAEATHRGFGEMVVAAALSALVIVTLEHRSRRGAHEWLVRLAAWTVIAASLIVVWLAYGRVRFYEAAFGYTQQRLWVQVCCGLVVSILLLLAWEIRSRIDLPRLVRRSALAAVVCLMGMTYWNSSAWIVSANVARYERTGRLDAEYLARLGRFSPDAIPELVQSLPRLTQVDAQRIRDSLRAASARLAGARSPSSSWRNLSWYEWSWRRAAARSALERAGLLARPPTE